jgi:protein phosphatase PTC7
MNLTKSHDLPLRGDGSVCGEDDFIITDLKHLNFLAVADGVGSWVFHGVNTKYFVSELMEVLTAKYHALNHEKIKGHDDERNSILYSIIDESIAFLNRRKVNINRGSCTLAALSLNLKTLHLNTYLMGDAGFMIVREGKIIYRSVDQLKDFNFPNQMGIGEEMDHPIKGDVNKMKLKLWDVIVIGSDGLFDNLFDKKILYIVNYEMSKVKKTDGSTYTQAAQNIVKMLTIQAKKLGERVENVWTPFGLEVAMKFQAYYSGGKNDDTTVVVAIVTNV